MFGDGSKKVVTIDGQDYVLGRCVADMSDGYSVYRTVDGEYIQHNDGGFVAADTPEWQLMEEDDFAAFERNVSEALSSRPHDLLAFLRDCGLDREYNPDRDYDVQLDSLEELRDWCAANPGALVMWGEAGEWSTVDELSMDADPSWWEVVDGTEEAEDGEASRNVRITVRG